MLQRLRRIHKICDQRPSSPSRVTPPAATRHWQWRSLVSRLLGAFVLASCVGGCAFLSDSQAVDTRETGIITVYTAFPADEAALYLRDFHLVFPEIQVNLVQAPIDQLTTRLLAEQAEPQADVIWGVGLTNLLLFEWNDLLKPYAPVGIERLDPRFIDARTPPYWVGAYLSMAAFCINADAAARRGVPSPHTWQELINPIYRRSLVMPNPNTSNAGLTVILTIFELYNEQDAWLYLDELHKNIATYTATESQTCRLVDSGDYPIGIGRTVSGLGNSRMIYPGEGSGWEITAAALVRKDPIQPAARTFLDWAMSKSVMPLYGRQSPLTGMATGAASPPGFPDDPEEHLLRQDASWGAANRSRILREWRRRYSDKVAK